MERGKRVVAKVVPNTRVKTLQSLIYKYVRVGSNLYSDEWDYGKDTDLWYYHRHVDHSKGFYGDGDLTSNGIESFWAVVKRSIMGIYYHWSKSTCRSISMNVFLDLILVKSPIKKDLSYFCKILLEIKSPIKN